MGLLAPWALLGPVVPAQPPLGPPLLCLGIHSSPVLPLSKSRDQKQFWSLVMDHRPHSAPSDRPIFSHPFLAPDDRAALLCTF